jgi:VCBS repeat-containing protein
MFTTGMKGRRSVRVSGLCILLLCLAVTHAQAAAPTISPFNDYTNNEDTVAGPIAFSIDDTDSPVTSLELTGYSSVTDLVPHTNIVFGGNPFTTNRTVTMTPLTNEYGTTTITIEVTDGTDTTRTDFVLNVLNVNDPPQIGSLPDTNVYEDFSTPWMGFAIQDVDGPTTNLLALSDDQVLLPNNRMGFQGSGIIRQLKASPAADENGDVDITVWISDGLLSNSMSFTLSVLPSNDTPEVSGTFNSPVWDNAGTNIFSNIDVTDVDHGRPANEILSLLVTLDETDGEGGTSLGSLPDGDSYSTSGEPWRIRNRLQSLTFTPTEVLFVDSTNQPITMVISDDYIAITNHYTLTIEAFNDPPELDAWVNPTNVPEDSTVTPFHASISDPDAGDLNEDFIGRLEFVDTNDMQYGSLAPAAPATTGAVGSVENYFEAIQFTAANLASNVDVSFDMMVTDQGGKSTTNTVTLTIVAANSSPNITGVNPDLIYTTDNPAADPVEPFPTVNISDADPQSLTVTLSLSDPAMGYFLGPTNFSGSASEVTSRIRTNTFKANQLTGRVIGETETVNVTIRVNDGVETISDSQTRIAITAVNGAPVVESDEPDPQAEPFRLAPVEPLKPFEAMNVYISDDDSNVTVTVALDDADKGTLSVTNAALESDVGFVESPADSGSYLFTGSVARVNEAFSNIVFAVDENYPFPPDTPGLTSFEITAVDSVLNRDTRDLAVVLQQERRTLLVTEVLDELDPDDAFQPLKGTLRRAVQEANNGDIIAFALPSYPAVIRLDDTLGPITVERGIFFKGPGADLLTISGDSDGNNTADTQLFRVFSWVTMEGVTLSRGSAGTGGAIYVGKTNLAESVFQTGRLTLRECALVDCTALQWGGAVDVDQGSLTVERSLFRGNTTDSTLGLGGGAVSLYTDLACSFINTTFASNEQQAAEGYGGGALYAENYSPSTEMLVDVVHCTFAGNDDVSDQGSALCANVFGTEVTVQNTIFADGQGRNLWADGSARILSDGGNVCDDSSRVPLTQGGSDEVTLLDDSSDQVNTDPLLAGYDGAIVPTAGYPLQGASPAIGAAVQELTAIDQRGVIRDSDLDSGALEYGATTHIIINEIMPDASGTDDFIELFVLRSSAAVDLEGYRLYVDDVHRHTFASPRVIQPGFGIVVADGSVTTPDTNTPVVAPSVSALDLDQSGSVTLKRPDPDTLVVAEAEYVGDFVDPDDPSNTTWYANNALTLCPQYSGWAFLPHSIVGAPPLGGADLALASTTDRLSSPGSDTVPTPFGSPNAYPVAQSDELIVDEDMSFVLDVLDNDLDADGGDMVVIVDVSRTTGEGGNDAVTTSVYGATVSIDPSTITDVLADPLLRGSSVVYDPTLSATIQALPQGAELTDSFYYEIIDLGVGTITEYAGTVGVAPVTITSAGHRLTNTEQIVISGAGVASYNVTTAVTRIDDDTFSIPVNFDSDPVVKGSWRTRNARRPSSRAEGRVLVDITGLNDPPAPVMDVITNVNEEKVVRIMGLPDLAGSTTAVFTTDGDYPMTPVIVDQSLLPNDLDPDSDDTGTTLSIIGVAGVLHPASGYSGTVGRSPVSVTASNHGLVEGDTILLSGYGGHASYNNLHDVSVTSDDVFTIPVDYVDDNPIKGSWAVLDDSNRLETTSALEADVKLEIRADPRETSITYNPRTSSYLDGLAAGEVQTDMFYCAVMDSHDVPAFSPVVLPVLGVNDIPEPEEDPGALDQLTPLLGDNPLSNVVAALDLLYARPAVSGAAGRADVQVSYSDTGSVTEVFMADMWVTTEGTALSIPAADLLENDNDIDRLDVLTVDGVSPVSRLGAAVNLMAASNVVYNPNASTQLNSLARGELVYDTFTATITDNALGTPGSVTSLVTVLVIGVNDKPRAFDDFETTLEDDVLTLPAPGLTGNDEEDDIDGRPKDDALLIGQVTNAPTPIDGVAVSTVGNALTYDPTNSIFLNGLAESVLHTDRYDHVVYDGSFLFAEDDLFKVDLNESNVVLDVLINDRNFNDMSEGMEITEILTPAVTGTVAIGAGGSNIVYTPPPDFVGEEVFAYAITDDRGYTDQAIVTVRTVVDRLNGDLQALDDHFSVARGETVLLDVLFNDHTQPEGSGNLDITQILTGPDQGGIAVINSGTVAYSADDAYAGAYPYVETFTYEMHGGGSALATARVDVLVIDRAGTLDVADDAYSVLANSSDNEFFVLANDFVLPESASGWSVASVSPTSRVQVSGSGNSVLYTPIDDYVGMDTLTYIASDGLGGTGTGTISVAVGNFALCNDAYTVGTNTTNSLSVLNNDRTLPADAAPNFSIVDVTPTNPAIGEMSIQAGSKRLVFEAGGAVGSASFAYTVQSAGGNVGTGQVTVVVAADTEVTASPDVYAVLQDSTGNELMVLENDTVVGDGNGGLSILEIVNAPDSGGVATIGPFNDRVFYAPAAEFRGEESFSYRVTDGNDTDTATVVLKVDGGSLHANDDAYTVLYEEPAGGGTPPQYTLSVLANDRVIPTYGQSLSIVAVGIDAASSNAPDQMGEVSIAPDGLSLVYMPTNGNFDPEYIERFTYEISDGTFRRDAAAVRVRVVTRTNAVELGTSDDAFAVHMDSQSNVLDVMSNDGVRPGRADAWSIASIQTTPLFGTAETDGTNVFYTPLAGFVGTDTFTYEVSDGLGGTGVADVDVTVGQLPRTPDMFMALSASSSNHFAVLANELILGRATQSMFIAEAGGTTAGGSVVIDGDAVLYTPNPAYGGVYPYTERFVYVLEDDTGSVRTSRVEVTVYERLDDEDSATLWVTVVGVNDPPVIDGTTNTYAITDEESVAPFQGVTITEVDDHWYQTVTVRVSLASADMGVLVNLGAFTNSAPGEYTFIGTGSNATASLEDIVFAPTINRLAANTTEQVRITIAADDGFVAAPVTDDGTVITVTPVNDPPTIQGTISGQRVHYRLTLEPFTGVTVEDVDEQGVETVDVTALVNQTNQGYLTSLGGFVDTGNGRYVLSNATPAAASAALRGLLFVPTAGGRLDLGESETTLVSIAVSDRFAPQVWDHQTDITTFQGFKYAVEGDGSTVADGLGTSVSANKDLVFGGAPFTDDGGLDKAGVGYVIPRASGVPGAEWNTAMKLAVTNGAAASRHLGYAVGLDDGTAVIGGPYTSYSKTTVTDDETPTGTGVAFIVEGEADDTNGWQLVTAIEPLGGSRPGDQFGYAVAIHGDTVVVGAPRQWDAASNVTGAAYIYQRHAGGSNAWNCVKKLVASDATDGARFGTAVAIRGDDLVIGAEKGYDGSVTSGVAYVFGRDEGGSNNWGEVKKVLPPDGALNDRFGFSTALDEDTLLMGAPNKTVDGHAGAGTVYVYERDNGGSNQWGYVTNLIPPEPTVDGNYGIAVGIDRGLIAVGVQWDLSVDDATPEWLEGWVAIIAKDIPGIAPWTLVEQNVPEGEYRYYISSVSLRDGVLAYGSYRAHYAPDTPGTVWINEYWANRAPVVSSPMDDQWADVGEAFAYTVPAGTFTEPDGDVLTLAMTAGPAWLSFDADTWAFSGTAPTAGLNTVTLQASDPCGETVTETFNITAVNWSGDYFSKDERDAETLEDTMWGLDADPDNDGYSNLYEYILGMNPRVADAPGMTPVDIFPVMVSPDSVTLTYNRARDDARLTFTLERSDSPSGPWVNADALIVTEVAVPVDDHVEAVTLTIDTTSLPMSSHFRITVDADVEVLW